MSTGSEYKDEEARDAAARGQTRTADRGQASQTHMKDGRSDDAKMRLCRGLRREREREGGLGKEYLRSDISRFLAPRMRL